MPEGNKLIWNLFQSAVSNEFDVGRSRVAQRRTRVNRDLIRADFDRIALVPNESDEDDELLSLLPDRMTNALELGCGQGRFARRLALRAAKVVAVDLSPKMIEVAKRDAPANVEFVVGDGVPSGEFDCAVSIATLHHMQLVETIEQLARALKPGGMLLVRDLYAEGKVSDYLLNFPGWVRRKLQRRETSAEARAAWAEHAKHDHFPSLDEVIAGAKVLPGARVTREKWWRYTLVWRKT
jgi:SAM-dependent methyltransferase